MQEALQSFYTLGITSSKQTCVDGILSQEIHWKLVLRVATKTEPAMNVEVESLDPLQIP